MERSPAKQAEPSELHLEFLELAVEQNRALCRSVDQPGKNRPALCSALPGHQYDMGHIPGLQEQLQIGRVIAASVLPASTKLEPNTHHRLQGSSAV